MTCWLTAKCGYTWQRNRKHSIRAEKSISSSLTTLLLCCLRRFASGCSKPTSVADSNQIGKRDPIIFLQLLIMYRLFLSVIFSFQLICNFFIWFHANWWLPVCCWPLLNADYCVGFVINVGLKILVVRGGDNKVINLLPVVVLLALY